jgi:conjugative relaxase-like TrwC/TraI family protein
MTARIRSISSAGNAGKYFYFLERNYECNKGWEQNEVTRELGLEKITRENLENVLNGKVKDGVYLGRMTGEGLKHHPGQEITFTAPKSVSIMALVAEDKRLLEAHEKAVSETLQYMNRNLIYARVQKDGLKYQEKTDNTITAKFTHITSRAVKDADNDKKPDPGLHTHALVANATKCSDGEFRSIVFDKVYENQLNISELYNINLARQSKEIGYNLAEGKTSAGRYTFEIEGVSDKDIKEFSQRRNNIMEVAREEGVSDVKGIEYIAKSTRAEKIKETQGELLKNWIERVNVKELYSIKEDALANKSPMHQIESNIKDNLSFAISHLSEREAVWEATELHKTIWQKAPLDYSIKDIEQIIAEEIKNKKVLTPYDENSSTYTTKQSLSLEKDVIKLMQDGNGKTKAIASNNVLNNILDKSNLTIGQKDSVQLIATSKDRVVGVQGTAGTGKTTMLKTVKDIVAEKNIELIGLAPTKAAANVFSDAVGVKSRTLKSFTMQYDGVVKGRGTRSGLAIMKEDFSNKLVILDEASLASSKDVWNLLKISERLDFKIVMVGDTKQQQGVEAGKPFYYLGEHGMNTAIQRDIKRQEAGSDLLRAVYQSEKAVDSDIASKDIYLALKAIGNNNITDISELQKAASNSQDKTVEPITNKNLAEKCYEKWKELKSKSDDVLLIAPSNDLRDKISELVREHYITGTSKEYNILSNTYRTKAQISDTKEYNGNEIVSFEKDIKNLGIKAYDLFAIEKINHYRSTDDNSKSDVGAKNGTINLLRISDNKKISWNPSQYNEFVSLYTQKNIKLAQGDKIKWTKNSKKHSFIVNGQTASIESISNNKIKIKAENGKTHAMSKSDIRFIDYGYATSTYSSQGKTSDYVIGILRAKEKFLNLTHQRSFYVTVSRAAKEAHLVIDNYKDLINSLSNKTGDKTSAISHQTKFDKNTSFVKEKAVDPEVKARAMTIKSTFRQLVSEYDNLEKLNPGKDSLSTIMKESVADFKLSQSKVSELTNNFLKNAAYNNPKYALKQWSELVNNYGLTKAQEIVEKNPEKLGELRGRKILFFNDKNRNDAIAKIKGSIDTLTSYTVAKDNLNVNKNSVDNLDKKYSNIYKSCFAFKTEGITYSKFKKDIEAGVKKALWGIDNIESKNIISAISKRVEEQIIECKSRYKKEPSISLKSEMFSKAKYEYEKKSFYLEKLNKEDPAKTNLDKIKQYQKADQLAKIEVNLLNHGYNKSFEAADQKAVFKAYDYYQQRVDNLTNSYTNQGYNKNQAENIANKIVNYEISNNNHASMRNLKVIETESKTFNLDKTIISNMGINEKDSLNFLSKVESIESQKINSKEKLELGYTTSNRATQSQDSMVKNKEITQDKSQEINKNMDIDIGI